MGLWTRRQENNSLSSDATLLTFGQNRVVAEILCMQGYTKEEAQSYQQTHVIASGVSNVEESIHRWLKQSLDARLPKGLIADIGCGSGRLLPWLRHPQRAIVGIDASGDMLSRIVLPGNQKPIIKTRFESVALGEELLIQSDLSKGLYQLADQGFRADGALSSFVLVCFSKPSILIDGIEQILKPNGLLWVTTNVFVPKEPLGNCELAASLRFKHWLHLPTGSILLHDYVHSLKSVMRAFFAGHWKILEHFTFPAEGCEHIEAPDCFSPQEPWTYVKAGFLVRRV